MKKKEVKIPPQAVQVLLDVLVEFPYKCVAPAIDEYRSMVEDVNRVKLKT